MGIGAPPQSADRSLCLRYDAAHCPKPVGSWKKINQNDSLLLCIGCVPAGFVATASWKIKDGNETLYGVAIDEKDDERQLRVYA